MTAAMASRSDPSVEEQAPLALHRQPQFLGWFASDTLTKIGGSLTSMALPILLVSHLGSTAQAGIIIAATSVGATVGMLPGGFLADYRSRPLTVVLSAVTASILHVFLSALIVFTQPGAVALIPILFMIGACSALAAPAFTATLKQIVDARQFGMAASAAEGRSAVIELAVPPLGGGLFALAPVAPFIVTAVVVLCGGLLFRTAAPRHAAKQPLPDTDERTIAARPVSAALEGFRYIFGSNALRALLLTGMLSNLAGSAIFSAVVFDLTNRGVSSVTIGLMGTCVALGALLGSVLSALIVNRVRSGFVIITGLVWMAACLVAAAIFATPAAIIALLAISMIAVPAINAVVGGYAVAVIPARLQGRTDAAQTLLSSLALPLAPVIAGVGVELVGFSATAALCASLLVVSALPCALSRSVRGISIASDWTNNLDTNLKVDPNRSSCLHEGNR